MEDEPDELDEDEPDELDEVELDDDDSLGVDPPPDSDFVPDAPDDDRESVR
ncbi:MULTISPECIES: hypothetical protein [unclassified Curtobacterium]|uniref:hypothetical protein n=1 Tax=unclassified Curtobacterium TaxID=257496 RepID=UPI0028166F4D|nr:MULTISPECIES: hypothetical protein [unclassified Curtobacterium]